MKLEEIDYKGIKLDKCAQCNGIWLDAGELDKIPQLE
jgi:Zn-finger nucleic acid-binding protein